MVKRYNKSDTNKNSRGSESFISESTNVLLSIKTLVLGIGFIFVVVFGFYRLVIEPKLEDLDKKYYLMYNQTVVINNNLLALQSYINNDHDNNKLDFGHGTTLPDGTMLPNTPSSYYIFDNTISNIEDTLINSVTTEQIQIHYNHQKIYPFYEDFLRREKVPLRSLQLNY